VSGSAGASVSSTGGAAGVRGPTGTGGAAGTSGPTGTGGTGSTAGTTGNAGSGTGTSGSDAGGPGNGVPDPNGPCRDLDLVCFDAIDMFILNPECSTCNAGMGCQACELFQAI
jgi:hypothetical protein